MNIRHTNIRVRAVTGVVALMFGLGSFTTHAQNFWQPTGGPAGLSVLSVAVDTSGNLFAGTNGIWAYRLPNGGSGWTLINSGLGDSVVNALAVTPSQIILAGTSRGLFRSGNSGATWSSTQLPPLGVMCILVVSGSDILVGSNGAGIYRSTNGGGVWSSTQSDGIVSAIAINSSNGLLFSGGGGGVFVSTDGGSVWTNSNLAGIQVTSVATNVPGYVFAGTAIGVFKSTDNGTSWTSGGLNNFSIRSLIVNASGHVFAGTDNGVFRSTDNAVTWNSVTAGLTNLQVNCMTSNAVGFLFAGNNTAAAGTGAVFRTVQSTVVPSATVLASPPDAAINQPTTPTLSWNASPGAASYRIQVSTVPTFTVIVFDDSTAGTSFQVGPFSNNSTYYWHVRGKNIGGIGPYSTSWSFTTVGVSGFSVTPTAIPFGSMVVNSSRQDSVIVTNTGTATLNITNVISTNGEFVVNPTTGSVAPSAAKSFSITFTPVALGPRTGNIIFSHDAQSSPDTVAVNGVGVAPGLTIRPRPLNFPAVGIGSSIQDTLDLFNTGTSALIVGTLQLYTAQPSEFLIVGNGGPFPSLAPSDSIPVAIRFAPGAAGFRTAMLVVPSNAASSPDSVQINGTGRAPAIQVALAGDTLAGNPLAISATGPAGIGVDSAKLFYRNAGKTLYDSLRMSPAGIVYQGNFPSSVVNARGIEYYVVLSTGQLGPITFPEVTPSQTPAVVRVKVGSLRAQIALKRRVYKMISVPLELNDATVAGELFDDYGQYDRSRWRLFRWENNANVEYPALTTPFSPGTAFWLVTQSGLPFDADNGRSVNSAVPATITLPQGWSQISCPYAFPVAWDTTSGLRGPFYYDNGQYIPGVRTLMPWEGYFVRNDSGQAITLSIPPVEASSVLPKGIVPVVHNGEYVVQLSATAGELEDTYNYIGFLDGAEVAEDRFDIPEPPFMGDFVALSIVDEGQRYIGNFKPKGNAGQQWKLQVSSTMPNQVVSISLSETGRLPEGYRVYVLDEDEFNAIPLNDHRFSIQLGSETAVRRLQIIIGTEQYARGEAGGIPLVPLEYRLDQNYPNPFNPTTTIRYQLNKRSDVILEVFNILGQRIRTLVHSEQLTGSYSTVWDGLSDTGVPVASGMYIYRLNAGEFVAGRKLILLR